MKYKKIKDLNASVMGLGCWAIGGTWNNVTEDQSIRTIKEALNVGINFFDIAPIYGFGNAEQVLGKALKGESRDSVNIATKCGLIWDVNDLSKTPKNNLSKASITKEIEDSLTRLGTDYVDLYQLHWPDPHTPIEETASALSLLKEAGKIRHIGVSNYSLEMTLEIQKHVEIATFQGLYNLLEQNPTHYHNIPLEYRARDEALPFCQTHDIKYLPYSPLMQGLLIGSLKLEGNWDEHDSRAANPKLNGAAFKPYFNCVEELKHLAQEANIPIAHLALHWLVAQEEIGSIIAGAYTEQQIRENAMFIQSPYSQELLDNAEAIVKKWQLE
ncbi:aldo/keto reductase [Vibrio renipiscarius]|uniref:Aldo/keto reductase n=1 Tax=Vibrio renipiscarius TaxID=1461322 RepID=A0A0C2NQM7_9VIBR|nr:aldo/keto reductase [Vibrio renipiscarius]KII76477.1 aldo/keto reductase [Vibrio renipiscarius]KII78001.1 aldo/keto reductase [Vibrio renipiscarius]